MSTSQIHGKAFEREVITTCFGVPVQVAESFSGTAVFDIPFGIVSCKHPTGDPVSIKTAALKAATKAATVCLADARRVWSWEGSLVLVVGLYHQDVECKRFHTVYEFRFQLTSTEKEKLYGQISIADVTQFHERLKTFGVGEHKAASIWAKAEKKRLSVFGAAIQLNPKIDSKMQRRLQCSARLSALSLAAGTTEIFNTEYRGLPLPFTVAGSSRKFRGRDISPVETTLVTLPLPA